MIDNLPSNKWAVISAVSAVGALLVPFILYLIGHESKNISVTTVSRAVLVNLSQTEGGSVTLTYNGMPVSHLTATTIEVRNDGTRPIERSDFERPLLIRFPKSSSILAATLGEKAPEDLLPTVTLEGGAITIAPLLLNPGDRFRVTAQLLGDFDEPTVESRISGIRAISRQSFRDSPFNPTRSLLTAAFSTSFCYVYLFSSIYTTIFYLHGRREIILPLTDGLLLTLFVGLASVASAFSSFDALNLSSAQKRGFILAIVTIWFLALGLSLYRYNFAILKKSPAPSRTDNTI
jgi:hypothetical protein